MPETIEPDVVPSETPKKPKPKGNGKPVEDTAIVPRGDVDMLMVEAVRSGNIEVMERVMAIRRELKAEAAKEAYFSAFAAFRSECPVIPRTKPVWNKEHTRILYHYAPLDQIEKVVGPIIARYGLSYSFKAHIERPVEKDAEPDLVMECHIQHEAGHVEVSPFRLPISGEYMNRNQQRGNTNSYAKRYSFCFAGETEIITYDGLATLGSLAGKSVKLLTRAETGFAKWVVAKVRSFGIQPLMRITLRRCGRRKVIYATPEHRWIVRKWKRKDAECVKITRDLKAGYILPAVFPKVIFTKASGSKGIRPSPYGIVHGFMFGDGCAPVSADGKQNYAGNVVLYGDKDAELLKFFPPATHLSVHVRAGERGYKVGGIQAHEMPRYFKLSPLGLGDESASYLFGWLSGYFAADGSVAADGEAVLCSANKRHLEIAQTVAARLGFRTFSIRSMNGSNGFKENASMNQLQFQKDSLPHDFYLLSHHRDRAIASGAMQRDRSNWRVESVELTGRVEEVFCAVVPGIENFVLADNVLTKNCNAFGIMTEDEDDDAQERISPNDARRTRQPVSQPRPTPTAQKAAQRANAAQTERVQLEPAGEGEGIDEKIAGGIWKAMEHGALSMEDFKKRFPKLTRLGEIKRGEERVVLSWIANPVEK